MDKHKNYLVFKINYTDLCEFDLNSRKHAAFNLQVDGYQ